MYIEKLNEKLIISSSTPRFFFYEFERANIIRINSIVKNIYIYIYRTYGNTLILKLKNLSDRLYVF